MKDARVLLVTAWLAFIAGLLAGGEIEDAGSLVIGAAAGAALVYFGFAAAARCRVVPAHSTGERARLAALSLAVGAGFGLANLAANWLIAASDPAIGAVMTERLTTIEPIAGLIGAPLVEEIMIRLFLMSAIAWVVTRFNGSPGTAFWVALVASSVVFASMHLDRPMPGDPALDNAYRAMLAAKYTIGGMPFGWIFWRWGLPYSILAHAAANLAHLIAQQALF